MQKLYIILLSIILSLSTLQAAHANTDYPVPGLSTYVCDPTTGIGTLKLVFGSTWHHVDTRYYTLNHKGWYSLTNANTNYSFANIPWTYIPGCAQACKIGPAVGITNHWPVGWKHDVMPWPVTGGGPIGNESHPDAYIHSGHWPNWVQARSGNANAARWLGDWEWETGSDGVRHAVGYGRTMLQFSPRGNGIGNCAKCSTSIDPSTLYSSPVTPKCDQGTVTGATSTVVNGITNYTWSCTIGGVATASCSAQYKAIDPTDCNEYRLPRQCSYGVSTVAKTQETSTGPLLISLVNQLPISTSPYAPGACRPPVDGKPRIVCDADPFTTISSTLSGFTLPSSVTQKQGSCRVIFDSADTCTKREDTITFKGTVDPPNCTKDPTNPACNPVVESGKVCIRLTDKFKNIITHIPATQVTITGGLTTDSYIETDTSRYSLGEVEVVDGKYCVVTKPPVTKCIPGMDPACTTIIPTECILGDPACTPTTPYCPPGATNCPGPVIISTVNIGIGTPGGRTSYTNDMATHPSGGVVIIKKKSCTGRIQVQDGEVWNTDGVMYDTEQLYRIVVDGSNPVCTGGTLALAGSGITATGGILDAVSPLTLSGGYMMFTAKILKPTDATTTERHPRGVYVSLMYTEPSGGIRYGLTASDSDFTDSPLLITGDRMKGVRILGNTLGSNMSIFNHNNGGVIAEQTALVTESRNAMIKNVNLLTRGMVDYSSSNKVINGILYKEGNVTYSSIESLNFQTLVVKGGDLTIDRDIREARGIIVMRGDKLDKGNIIIADGVRSLYASIFAEGTFRGASLESDNKNPDIQLVLRGSLFSRNTIGGSADPVALYTSGNASTTDLDTAFVQDLNHVRSGNGGAKYKGYTDPFIVDYDNMQGSPLPGFSN